MLKRILVCLSVFLLFLAQDAFSKERPWRAWPTGKRFAIAGGGFWPKLDTKVRVDASDGTLGTNLDFESNLGMEDTKALFIGLARWRISRRNAIDFQVFNLDRSGQEISDTFIRFGDVIFLPNIPINSFFDSDIYSAAWSYSFVHNPTTDIAFQIGLNIQDIAVGLSGPAGIITEEASFTAPLPTFGATLQHFFTDKWAFDFRLGVFAIDLDLDDDSLSGEVVNLSGGLSWDTWKHMGFRASLDYFHVKVDVDATDWSGALRYDWWGPTLSLNVFF